MIERFVYMDNNATTPLHPEVQTALREGFELFGNPSSMHSLGRSARYRIEEARNGVASFLGADADEIVFAGSGSEANNAVLNLVPCSDTICRGISMARTELITTAIEHPCVLNTARCLVHQKVKTHYLAVDATGRIDLDELGRVLSERTALVSVMMANNEIGTVQDIRAIARLAHEKGALVHTDAVQAVGKIPVNVRELDVDFLTFSAHKFYGPKGVGGLFIRKGVPFCSFIRGGHQEHGRRAGTENTLGILGLGKAVELVAKEMTADAERIGALRERLRAGIETSVPDIHVNGHPVHRVPGTLNVSFRGSEGEAILLYLDLEGIAVSTGSACASGSLDPSHVLLATGVGAELAHGSIRFSIGRFNTEAEIDYVLEKLPPIIERIRKMSTVYQKKDTQK